MLLLGTNLEPSRKPFLFLGGGGAVAAYGILVPWSGIELGLSVGTVKNHNHWTTREFPETLSLVGQGGNTLGFVVFVANPQLCLGVWKQPIRIQLAHEQVWLCSSKTLFTK